MTVCNLVLVLNVRIATFYFFGTDLLTWFIVTNNIKHRYSSETQNYIFFIFLSKLKLDIKYLYFSTRRFYFNFVLLPFMGSKGEIIPSFMQFWRDKFTLQAICIPSFIKFENTILEKKIKKWKVITQCTSQDGRQKGMVMDQVT